MGFRRATGATQPTSSSESPQLHASTHASGGSDAVTVAQSQVTSLTTDLAAKAPLASPTFTGTPAAPSAAQNTNTTQIATTAFVLGQGNSTAATIAMNGTQAAGSSNLYARADHVHPSDTSRAPLASPTFTGTLTANTVLLTTADTATTATHYMVETGTDGIIRPKTLANARTEIVTTAAVNAAAATTVGTITSGTWQGSSISTTYTDAKVTSVNGSTGAVTGLATLASPTFTGTPAAPTAAASTNTTQIATTAFVQTVASTAGGLVFITSQSFTTASAVNVNNCFTSTYENYRVIINLSGSAGLEVQVRMRASSSDDSGANYNFNNVSLAFTNTTYAGENQSGATSMSLRRVTTNKSAKCLDVFGPQTATNTVISWAGVDNDQYANLSTGRVATTTQYDGFSIIAATGSITGTVRVYGYRNA